MNSIGKRLGAPLVTACALAMACAHQPNSKQMLDARAVIHDAERSSAAELAPDKLLVAKQLLEQAEREDSGSPEEIHYAYMADRQARLAMMHAATTTDEKDLENAKRRYVQEQEQLRRHAEGSEARMKDSLATTRAELATVQLGLQKREGDQKALEARRIELEKQLSQSDAALGEEKSARADAEKRAAAALASLALVANVKEDGNETVITLSGAVIFKTNESGLLPIAKEKLDLVVAALKELDGGKLAVVRGHTDSRGADEKNLRLSEQRANAVREYLVEHGVKTENVKAEGKGETQPVATNDTPEGRADNRRVEIHIQKAPR